MELRPGYCPPAGQLGPRRACVGLMEAAPRAAAGGMETFCAVRIFFSSGQR